MAGVLAVVGAAVQAAYLLGDNAFAWTGAGFTAGAGITLPVERLRAAFFAAARLWPDPVQLQAVCALLGTGWCSLGAPVVFDRWPRSFGVSAPAPQRLDVDRERRGSLPSLQP